MPRNDRIVRLETVRRALCASRRGVCLKTLAERHGWKLRNLYRDIEALEAAGYAVAHEEHRFRIDGEDDSTPSAPDSDERLALYMARQGAKGWKETSLGRALDRLWYRLSSAGDGQAALVPTDSTPWIAAHEWAGTDYANHRQILRTLEHATRSRLAVNARYRAISTGEISRRVIEPGEMYWDSRLETMYLIGWCRLRKDVRVFAAHRFLAVSLTEDTFLPRAETRSRTALRKAFRVWRSAHVQTVRIWFDGNIAPEIQERTWLSNQQLIAARGGVILTGEVAGLTEVERWILSYGPSARVLDPTELVRGVARKLRLAAASYRSDTLDSLARSDKPAS